MYEKYNNITEGLIDYTYTGEELNIFVFTLTLLRHNLLTG